MPELKHSFTGGKMNKDLDERLVPNGEYRHAMNVQVSTSEGSDVGTIQNILGNYSIPDNRVIPPNMKCIGSISDEKNDSLYWFIASSNEYQPTYTMLQSSTQNLQRGGFSTKRQGPQPPTGRNSDYFTLETVANAIMKYSVETGIEAVVWEAKTTICSLGQIQVVGDVYTANDPINPDPNFIPQLIPGWHNLFLSPSSYTNLNVGMQLVKIEFLDSNFTVGQSGSVISTYDLSGNPPTITYKDTITSSIQLSNLPSQLANADLTTDIIALHFTNPNGPLNFDPDSYITGINIIDDMLFWTDNINEPKKINIPRCIEGTPLQSTGRYVHTRLICEDRNISYNNSVLLLEDNTTMIKHSPSLAPSLELKTGRDETQAFVDIDGVVRNKSYTGVIEISSDNTQPNDLIQAWSDGVLKLPYDFSGINVGDKLKIQIQEDVNGSDNFELLWPIELGTLLVLKEYNEDGTNAPPLPVTDYRIKTRVSAINTGNWIATPGDPIVVTLEILAINGFPPQVDISLFSTRKYVIDLFDQIERLFEFKFPRFATRYIYEDGEYSSFSPWTEVAFVPGTFDYHPRKGYNLGMTNRLKEVWVKNFRLNDTPLDVVAIEILYKEDASPNIYVIDTIKPNDSSSYWDEDFYIIKGEAIKSVVPSNQLLRSWDNVPRKALAQEVVGNRIVYANYVHGFNLIDILGKKYRPEFKYDILENDEHPLAWNTSLQSAARSIKSLREYQLGVAFVDKYGRETPVISNNTGTFKLEKKQSAFANRLRVGFHGIPPEDMEYYKFYIKQTSGEYYNLAMDRWYDAEDGNIWVGFPSSDRNKVDEDTFIILKKGADSNVPVEEDSRFKIIAIENEAPDFIKQKRTLIVDKKHNDAAAGTNLFGSGTIIPRENFDEFSMSYAPFWASSGNKLHEIEDDLYVSFTQGDASISSKRYRITSLTFEQDDDNTTPDLYHVKLDENMGDDVNFLTDDPINGTNVTQVEGGTKVKIWKYKTENGPEFDGRFFVKLFKNEVTREHIQGGISEEKDYATVVSKKIYLMRTSVFNQGYPHFVTHSRKATGHGYDVQGSGDFYNAYSDHFGRYACYFRMYDYGNSDPTEASYSSNKAKDRYRFKSPSSLTYDDVHNQDEYNSWKDEYNLYTGHNTTREKAREYLTPNRNGNFVEGHDARADGKNLRDNEVWFIDQGRYTHSHPSYPGIWWWNVPWGNIDNDNPAYSVGLSGGSMKNASSRWFRMSLGFGPVITNNKVRHTSDADPDSTSLMPDVFNVGAGNPMYEGDSIMTTWIDQVSPGSSWRWKEDPDGMIHDIDSGGVSFGRKLRYYGGRNDKEQGSAVNEYNYDKDVHRAAQLSTNINSTYGFVSRHKHQINWIPVAEGGSSERQEVLGPINGGATTTVTTIASGHVQNNNADDRADYHIIVTKESFENSIMGVYPNFPAANTDALEDGEKRWRVQPGMILKKFVNTSDETITLTGEANWNNGLSTPHLVVRKVEQKDDGTYKIFLTGYHEALDDAHLLTNPKGGVSYNFVQATMNGYSPNSAARISLQKSTTGLGAFTDGNPTVSSSKDLLYAVGYTMEFVEEYVDKQGLPENPAIFETEPKELPELDIYYEASGLIPFEINSRTMSTLIPLKNEQFYPSLTQATLGINIGTYEDCSIQTSSYTTGFTIPPGTKIVEINGNELKIDYDLTYESPTFDSNGNLISGDPFDYSNITGQTGYNAWGTGIHTSGVSIAAPFLQHFTSPTNGERIVYIQKPDGSSFSGQVIDILQDPHTNEWNRIKIGKDTYNYWHTLNWYNCYSFLNGVESNRIRDNYNLPFISNGVKASTTLSTDKYVQENRSSSLIYSGLYNELGSINNLNQFIAAEKITKELNPEYGSVQKLHSRDSDLIALCEDKVLKILANKDAVYNADGNPQLTANQNVLGQTIPYVGEYGISKNPESFASEAYRAYFTDKVRGAVMRLSKDGLTPISEHGMKDWFRDNLRLSDLLIGNYDDRQREYNISVKDANYVVSFDEDVRGWPSFKSFVQMESGISMANNYYTFYKGKIYLHHNSSSSYNQFYNILTPSSVTALINEDPGTVKNFQTLSYEGSQARISPNTISGTPVNDGEYYNLTNKSGWYVNDINTDLEEGSFAEFIEKEGKWFNYIKGFCGTIEDKNFNYQGVGIIQVADITQTDGSALPTSTSNADGNPIESLDNLDSTTVNPTNNVFLRP